MKVDSARARLYLDSALATIDHALTAMPDDPRLHAARGRVLAGMGRKDEAIREGLRATELLPLEKEAWRGRVLLENLARIYAATGEADHAAEILRQLLGTWSDVSKTSLRNDPARDRIRGTAAFRRLL